MPVIDLPKIGSDNTIWSDQKRMLAIGNKKVQVSPDSTKKIPTFAQYIVMASAIRRLLDEEMESTIRGMYYATLTSVGDEEKGRQKFWNSQENSDDAIKAIELLTAVPREEFSVTSKPKGMISGPAIRTAHPRTCFQPPDIASQRKAARAEPARASHPSDPLWAAQHSPFRSSCNCRRNHCRFAWCWPFG